MRPKSNKVHKFSRRPSEHPRGDRNNRASSSERRNDDREQRSREPERGSMRSQRGEHGSRPNYANENDTSWQKVAGSYNKSVGNTGHYYHQHVVIPGVIKMLHLKAGDSLLDLGCGQGVLARSIKPDVDYDGVDLASDLIKYASEHNRNERAHFHTGDITQSLKLEKTDYSHTAIILALQNVENYAAVITNAAKHLKSGGKFVIVLNHPSFRIPRQSSWGIDEQSKLQYRRVNIYMESLKIPVDMTPGGDHKLTWSFHNPLSAYTSALNKAGFMISNIEEWVSDKESEGKARKMENRSRAEIPLFMALECIKK